MTISRVRYRERQTLRPEDLQEEQAYLIGMRRRHQIAHHGWGIVYGLTLSAEPRHVLVHPGMAVDGYGRDLIVAQPLRLTDAVVDAIAGQVDGLPLDIYLSYRLCPPPEQAPCDPQRRPSLSEETAWLRVECADSEQPVDPDRPPGLTDSDLAYAPHDPPMRDPEREWPIYLGRVWALRSYPGWDFSVVLTRRRYVHLIGGQIAAPWQPGKAWMLVGNEEAADRRRFTVSMPDAQGKAVDRLLLDRQGNAEFKGRLRTSGAGIAGLGEDGGLILSGAADERAPSERPAGTGLALASIEPLPEAARSWQLYRTQDAGTGQMRFEILDPGEEGDAGRQEWTIGLLEAGQLRPRLTVRADGTVVIDGELWIQGQLVEGPIPADVDNDRFRDELLSRWTKGLTSAGNEVDAFYKLTIDIIAGPNATDPQILDYQITLTNGNTGPDARDVLVSSIELEVRDAGRQNVHFQDLSVPVPNPPPQQNPVLPGGTLDVSGSFTPGPGVYTLVATVRTVGGSQTPLEQSASRVIEVS